MAVLVALHAGCTQQPGAGVLIGVNSTLFTKNEVVITSPMLGPPQPPTPHKSLSKGSVIAISVVCGVAALLIITFTFIWCRRRRHERRLRELQSPLDARFGAPNISAPHSNAYASPESPPIVKEAIHMSGSPHISSHSRQASLSHGHYRDQESPAYSPPPFGASIPTHHAYLPPQYTPRSRTSPSPKYGSSPTAVQHLPSVPYPDHTLSPTNSTSTWAGRSPPPAVSPPPAPPTAPMASPPAMHSPSSHLLSPSAVLQPSPAASTPSTGSTFSFGRKLQRSSNSSTEPFLNRFSLSQRSFGRGRTGTRQDARRTFQISSPVVNATTGPGFHAAPANNVQPNNRRRSTESTGSDPLW